MNNVQTATDAPAEPTRQRSAPRRFAGRVWRAVPAAVALAGLVGVVLLAQQASWKLPKASALGGAEVREADDWCAEHGVPESVCVECRPRLLPAPPHGGWCKEFGVHDCPFCDPSVAQTPRPTSVTPAELDRARRALAFAPRPPNGKGCRLHERRVQLASAEVVARLGIGLEAVTTAPVVEGVSAPAEVGFDPTRVARLAPRLSGVVRRVEKRPGDAVEVGEIVALVEAAGVGKAKADFQQALAALALRAETLARKRERAGATVSGQEVREAEAALEEATLGLVASEQALAGLGLPVRADEVKGLSPAELAARLRFLGLPEPLQHELGREVASGNLLPVRSPLAGEVVSVMSAPGDAADPAKPLLVAADTSRVWVTLRIRSEDADRVRSGQPVRFRPDDRPGQTGSTAEGVVAWVSPAADERTRTVPVRVELPNPGGRLRAGAAGTAFVALRAEKDAVVVPSDAIHWEGCCNVAFVAVRGFDDPGGYKVFHIRKVRPGAKDVTPAGTPVTEVVAGLLPGERVAVANSGVLRSELLRNNLGEG